MVNNKYRDRWNQDSSAWARAVLTGKESKGPFPLTDDGFVDLMGLNLDKGMRVSGATVQNIDLSFSEIASLIFAESDVRLLRARDARIGWGDYDSTLTNLNFQNVVLSGGFGNSVYENCSFDDCVLDAGSAINPIFARCQFVGITAKLFFFKETKFDSCRLSGTLTKCFFTGLKGGGFYRCDISGLVLHDCRQQAYTVQDCVTGDRVLVIRAWQEMGGAIENAVADIARSNKRLKRYLALLAMGIEDAKEKDFILTFGEMEAMLRDKQVAEAVFSRIRSIVDLHATHFPAERKDNRSDVQTS